MKTKQEIFNIVWDHFVKGGGQQSLMRDERDRPYCQYRLDGTASCTVRCAVGLLIPDDQYHSGLEASGAGDVAVIEAAGLTEETTKLAVAMQSIHDLWFESFDKRMRELARIHELVIPD